MNKKYIQVYLSQEKLQISLLSQKKHLDIMRIYVIVMNLKKLFHLNIKSNQQ